MPGPFDQYLAQSVQQQPVPQATGWEGGPANIAFIAQKFLEGAKQARTQKFLQDQEEQARQQQGYQIALKALQDNPNLLPAKRQELMAPLMQGLISQVTGAKENSKTTGHPLTDAVKNIFTNMTGGQMGTKAQPLDMGLVGNAFTQMQLPENTIQHHLSAGSSELSQLLHSMGPDANAQAFLQDPRAQAIINRVRDTTGQADWIWDGLKALPTDPVAAQMQAAKTAALKDVQNPPVGPAPVVSTSPIPGTVKVPGAVGVYAGPGEVTLDTVINAHRGEQSRAKLIPEVAGPGRFKIGDTAPYRDEKGKLFNGMNVTSTDPNYPSGIYDTQTKKLVINARPNTAGDASSTFNYRLMAKGDKFPFEKDIYGNPKDPNQTYAPQIQAGVTTGIMPIDIRKVGKTVNTPNGPRLALMDPVSGETIVTDEVPLVQQGTNTVKGSDSYGRDVTQNNKNFAPPAQTATPPAKTAPKQTGSGLGTPSANTAPGATPAPPGGIYAPLKNLDAASLKQVDGIDNSLRLAKELRKYLSIIDPATKQPFYKNNDWTDAVKQRYNAALYNAGLNPGDIQEKILQLASLTSIQGTTPYTQGSVARQTMERVQEHLPKAVDTPNLIWQKLDTIDSYLPGARDTILRNAGTRVGPGRVVGGAPAPEATPPPGEPNKGNWGSNPFRKQGAAAGPPVNF